VYLTVDQVEAALVTATSGAFHSFSSLIPLPNKTWENRQCNAIRIGKSTYPGRPTIFFLGGLHAREWGSCDILISFIERLQDAYVANMDINIGNATFAAADIQSLVNDCDIIVFPQANPDGRNYSMTNDHPVQDSLDDAMWRKNRRTQSPNSSVGDCVGVDLNRNFDFLWDFPNRFSASAHVVDSTTPCDHDLYHGPGAFSEPETQNVKWIFDTLPNIGYFMDVHSYGGLIMYSWGDDEDQTSDTSMTFMNSAYDGQRGVGGDNYKEYIPAGDLAYVVSLANAMQSGVKSVRGTNYLVQPDYGLYPTAGTSDDYAYSRHFVDPSKRNIISMALEWGNDNTGFVPPYSDMATIIDDVVAGLLNYCIAVRNSLKGCVIITDPSSVGVDEVDALRNLPGGPIVPDAVRVVVDGFSAAELGITDSQSKLPDMTPTAGLVARCTGNTSDTGNYGPQIQRFTFHYNLDFGPDDSAFNFAGDTEMVDLHTAAGGISASAQLELVKQPDPFMLHGDPSWLSIDLRVFPVRPGETHFGQNFSAGTSPTQYIRNIMAALNQGAGSAGGQAFSALPQDEQASALFLNPTDSGGKPVFNFALARVRYIGTVGAPNVRVFFRLFQAQSTSTAYDGSTTYNRAASNPLGQPIPLPGIQANEYVTLPFFCFDRVNSASQSLDQQVDSAIDLGGNPYGNVQNISPNSDGSEVDTFFGCWLDTNQPQNNVLPMSVPPANQFGAFTDPNYPPQPIQLAILRSPHQCLVAEVAFDNVPIVPGKDPSSSDKLAQRNLAWSDLPNPGHAESRQAITNFEIRPTPARLQPGQSPDELMIDWSGVPAGSVASIYMPAVKATDVVASATRMYTTHRLSASDAHTIRCPAEGITYIPIPPGTAANYAGLLSVELPAGLKKGQRFDVIVRQVTNAFAKDIPVPARAITRSRARIDTPAHRTSSNIQWRRVFGAFQLAIPVSTKEQLLQPETRTLSIMRWIGQSIPSTNRWYPVFQRYLKYVSGRVSGFGGDPGKVRPSPTGDGSEPWGHEPFCQTGRSFTGKVQALIFDRFGDFEGFLLLTEDGHEHLFCSQEPEIQQLTDRAWRQRMLVTVIADHREEHRPNSIILRRVPPRFAD